MLFSELLLSLLKSAHGQEFISAIDPVDRSPLQDLPSSQTPVQSQPCSPPTSAHLHLLAASVINSNQNNTEIRTEEHTDDLPGTEILYTEFRRIFLGSKIRLFAETTTI